MATETMAIIEAGGYRSPTDRDVLIGAGVGDAVAGTRLYLPDETPPRSFGKDPGDTSDRGDERVTCATATGSCTPRTSRFSARTTGRCLRSRTPPARAVSDERDDGQNRRRQ
jgi:hypothetical protein